MQLQLDSWPGNFHVHRYSHKKKKEKKKLISHLFLRSVHLTQVISKRDRKTTEEELVPFNFPRGLIEGRSQINKMGKAASFDFSLLM